MTEDKNKTSGKKPLLPNIKYLFGILVKQDTALLALMLFTLMVQALLPLWQIFIPKKLLDLLMGNASPRLLFENICIIGLVTLLLHMLSTWGGCRYEARIGLARTGIFRVMLIRKLFRMKYASFEEPGIRELTARAWNVTWSNNFGVEGALRHLMKMAAAFLTLLGLAGTLAVMGPEIPLLLLGFAYLDKRLLHRISGLQLTLREDNIAVDRRLDYINKTMQDMSYGKEIRIMGMGGRLISWHKSLMGEKMQLFCQERKACTPSELFQLLIAVVREITVYGYLVYAVWSKGETVADFTLFFGAALGFSGTLGSLLSHYEAFIRDAVCIEDMREMMALPEENMAATDMELERFLGKPIILDDICYRYPMSERDAVSHFSHTFLPGRRTALVGENGSGKTTLVKLICGFLEPDSGVIRFGDVDGKALSGWQRYALFSIVFQDINVYAFTLGENAAMAEKYDSARIKENLSNGGLSADNFAKGLDTMLCKVFAPDGAELSGGQRQALAIARALSQEKAVMTILDEPTAALDPIAESEIYGKLDKLIQGRSSIFISHRLASTRFCDEILVMKHGVLVEEGEHDSLMALKGCYAEMFEAQSSYYQKEAGGIGGMA